MPGRLPACPGTARKRSLLLLLGAVLLASSLVTAAEDPYATVAPILAQAERSLLDGELESAESFYREALLEGWVLVGAVDLVAGKREAAIEAWRRASTVAASKRRPEALLARVRLGAGLEILGDLGPAPREPGELATARQGVVDGLSRAYSGLALLALRSGREGRVARFFAEAAALDPAAAPPHSPAPTVDHRLAQAASGLPSVDELHALLARGDDPRLRNLLGIALSRENRLEEAAGAFRRALELDPGSVQTRQNLARLLLLQGQIDAALRELRLAAGQGEIDRDLRLQLASIETRAGNRQAAELQLVTLVERFSSVRALLELARLADEAGEADRALGHLAEAIRLAPSSEDVLAAYARVAVGQRAPVTASEALEPLIRMHPDVAEYPYLLGTAHLEAGDASGAVAALERAVEIDPAWAEGSTRLGVALSGSGRLPEAEAVLTASLRLEPGQVEALAALSETLVDQGRTAEAEQLALRALSLGPDHARANLALGLVRLAQERWDDALEALLRAAAADPADPEAQRQLALAYSRRGDATESEAHLALQRAAQARREELRRALTEQAGGGTGR